MSGHGDFNSAINKLVDDIETRDVETNEMKRMVNKLCGYANLPVKYPNVDDVGSAARGVRISAGQFYRKPLATAVAGYLKMRGDQASGGSGPATLEEIFDALREGGFVFDAKNEGFAKRSLAIAIAKNSQTFEKLPTGQFGMKSWFRKDREGE